MSNFIVKRGETIPLETRSLISTRYKSITKAINREFRNIYSDTAYSLYVGSYGRGTAIDTSDIDMLVELPRNEYNRYNMYKENGQSRLLQAVRDAVLSSYPRTEIRADGQVVKVCFSDGMKYEILPAFAGKNWNGEKIFEYPDTNMGGNWRTTNPIKEQSEMRIINTLSRGLLFDACKHIRYIRDNYYSSYHLSGIVIDSFVFASISGHAWGVNAKNGDVSDGDFEIFLYGNYLNNYRYATQIPAPGSKEAVSIVGSKECLEKVLYKMIQ